MRTLVIYLTDYNTMLTTNKVGNKHYFNSFSMGSYDLRNKDTRGKPVKTMLGYLITLKLKTFMNRSNKLLTSRINHKTDNIIKTRHQTLIIKELLNIINRSY
jgi:hypothetical protein